MPTASDAAATARREAEAWWDMARRWEEPPADLLPPRENEVISEYDVAHDIARRMKSWGHAGGDGGLGDLLAFGASLAATEADAWASEDRVVATSAYADRRFLLGDRILPWAVPWLEAATEYVDHAGRDRDLLLSWGDVQRPMPALTAPEGTVVPGHDGYGGLTEDDLTARVRSLTGGLVVFRTTVEGLLGRGFEDRGEALGALVAEPELVIDLYRAGAERWHRLAADHRGSAAAWRDLADRAERTADLAAS